jgi:glutamate decarboxylase
MWVPQLTYVQVWCRYGLVYPGVGWIIFRSKDYLPESLVFHDNYL